MAYSVVIAPGTLGWAIVQIGDDQIMHDRKQTSGKRVLFFRKLLICIAFYLCGLIALAGFLIYSLCPLRCSDSKGSAARLKDLSTICNFLKDGYAGYRFN